MNMKNDNFYKQLDLIYNIDELVDTTKYTIVPNDWYILMTDIKNSTQAIKNGLYKDINMMGAMCIIGVMNIDKNIEIPFVFGGDGATILIPKILLDNSKDVLKKCKEIAKINYQLDLRIKAIPIEKLQKDDTQLLIAKLNISDGYHQAILKGNIISIAEDILKHRDGFEIENTPLKYEVSFTGLECRWEAIKAPKDYILSLLIQSTDEEYSDILKNINAILGTKKERQPLNEKNLHITLKYEDLKSEIQMMGDNIFMKSIFYTKIFIENMIGKLLIGFKIGDYSQYKQRIINTSDSEKFEDMIKMVVSVDFGQIKKLEEYLEKNYLDKKLIYGMYKSDEALMTCLIFQRHGKHIHFIDGNDGGYTMAAREFKKRLKNA